MLWHMVNERQTLGSRVTRLRIWIGKMSGAASGFFTLSAVSVAALFKTFMECFDIGVAGKNFSENFEQLCALVCFKTLGYDYRANSERSELNSDSWEDLTAWFRARTSTDQISDLKCSESFILLSHYWKKPIEWTRDMHCKQRIL
jgi:hypothetical protein